MLKALSFHTNLEHNSFCFLKNCSFFLLKRWILSGSLQVTLMQMVLNRKKVITWLIILICSIFCWNFSNFDDQTQKRVNQFFDHCGVFYFHFSSYLYFICLYFIFSLYILLLCFSKYFSPWSPYMYFILHCIEFQYLFYLLLKYFYNCN